MHPLPAQSLIKRHQMVKTEKPAKATLHLVGGTCPAGGDAICLTPTRIKGDLGHGRRRKSAPPVPHAVRLNPCSYGINLDIWAPTVVQDENFRRSGANYLRRAASPGAALAVMRMNRAIDVRHVLPAIRTPTLILHRFRGPGMENKRREGLRLSWQEGY